MSLTYALYCCMTGAQCGAVTPAMELTSEGGLCCACPGVKPWLASCLESWTRHVTFCAVPAEAYAWVWDGQREGGELTRCVLWQSGTGSLTKEKFLLVMQQLDPSVDDKARPPSAP